MIAVASGKGGVGKSTLTANLAYALSALGEQVGVLDGDIYGHSIPHMLGVHQKPIAVDEMIVPPVRGDLKLMSIGFFLEENAPIMWRGPMLHKALEQFLSDVHWGELDTLLVDMPPGTGDVAMSLGQLLPRAEALVVTTPQPAAQQVAVRAAQMAQKTGCAILGAVENMSYLVGTGQELFGSGGGQALADEMGVPLLARIPLDPLMREAADDGCPVAEVAPDSEAALASPRSRSRSPPRGRARSASRSPSSRRSPRAGRRVLRSRPDADLALELALARAGVPRGGLLLGRRDRTKAVLAQLVFMRYGAGTSRVGQTAESAMVFLKGLPVEEMREIVEEAVDSAFRPHVYREALDLVARASRARRALVHRVGGAPGDRRRARRRARLRRWTRLDGRGRGRRVHGPARAAPRRPGEGGGAHVSSRHGGHRPPGVDGVLRLGQRRPVPRGRRHAVAVNPDRRLRGIAAERGWRVLRFGAKAFPGPMTESDARGGSRHSASTARPSTRSSRTSRTRSGAARPGTASRASSGSRRSASIPPRGRCSSSRRRASSAGTVTARSATSCSRRSCARRSTIRPSGRVWSSRGAAFPPASLGYWVRRLAEGGLVAALTATSPRRLPHPDGGAPLTGTNPLAIAIPSSDGPPWSRTSRWAR